MTTFDSGSGAELVVGGDFRYAGEMYAGSLARWNGQVWSPMWLGQDPAICSDAPTIVDTLAVLNLGAGPRLHAGGYIDFAGTPESNIRVHNLAGWDGTMWEAVTSGIYSSCFVGIRCVDTVDVGGGTESLCAGGSFYITSMPGVFACLGVWNGHQWSLLGGGVEILGTSGFSAGIHAIISSGELEGSSLYVAGNPTRAGAVPVSGIARWDGRAWHDVGGGVNVGGGIYAMTMFDDGSGPALYIGGRFSSAGGTPARNIAKWDGQRWSSLGSGTNGPVRTLQVWDRDDSGPEAPGLYIGGEFTVAGGINSTYIAKWQGCDTCYADCDSSTGPRNLDIFDFLCFQNRYEAGTSYACDCDTSTGAGVCDIFDFLCFQNAYSDGCP